MTDVFGFFYVECQNFIDDEIYNKDLPYMYEQQ